MFGRLFSSSPFAKLRNKIEIIGVRASFIDKQAEYQPQTCIHRVKVVNLRDN